MILRPVLFALMALAGCGSEPAPLNARDQIDREVQAIVARCGLRGKIDVALEDERLLRVDRIDIDTDHREWDCFMAGIRPLGLNLGFVGNEMPDRNEAAPPLNLQP